MSGKHITVTKDQLEQKYIKESLSIKNVAAFFNCSVATINRHLHNHGIRVRSQSEEMTGRILKPEHRAKIIQNLRNGDKAIGESNPNWKGGRSWKGRSKNDKDKYTIILVNGKYVPEHRYVMEQQLGYQLGRDLEVHHINGNKRDNRIDNLQVWTKKEHARIHMTTEHKEHLSEKTRQARATRFWSTTKKI